MKEVSQLIQDIRGVGENIASISQDIGLLIGGDRINDANISNRVKHSKSLVESILSVMTVLSSTDFNALDRHEELFNEVRKIEFSCVGLQSILSQSLIDIAIFKTHKFEIKNFLQAISMAANKIITISLVSKFHNNILDNSLDVDIRTETSCFGDETTEGCCCEDNHKQNDCYPQDMLGDEVNSLNSESDVCYKDKTACEQDCDGICLEDKCDGLDISRYPEFSETPKEITYKNVESGHYEQKHYIEHSATSDLRSNHEIAMDGIIGDTTPDSTQNLEQIEDTADVPNEVYCVSEVNAVENIPDVTNALNEIDKQESKENKPAFVDSDSKVIQSYSYHNINEGVILKAFKTFIDNLFVTRSEFVDTSSTDYTTNSKYEASDEEYNTTGLLGSSTNEAQTEPGQSGEVDSDSNQSVDSIENHEVLTEGSDITPVEEEITTTDTPVTESFQYTYETPTTVSYEITTENIESATEYYYETTTECTTPAYETTTEDLYKVSQDIYSAAQDLSTKANEISSITSDISSKISNINSMVSDLNTYDDDELSKKIQSVSKITQDISSKTSEMSSLCSTTSSLASDISSASSDMPSADRHHRFRTSPWQKMSTKCQEMVTACQYIVTAAQDILLNLDSIVSHTETLKVADAVSTGVYDVTAKTQLVISETLNIVSAVIELMNVIES